MTNEGPKRQVRWIDRGESVYVLLAGVVGLLYLAVVVAFVLV